jgi:hypothetical protein
LAEDCAFCGLSSGPCFSGVSSPEAMTAIGVVREPSTVRERTWHGRAGSPAPRFGWLNSLPLHGLSRGSPKEQRELRHARFCRGRIRAIAQPSMSSSATSASVEEEKSRAGLLLVVQSGRGSCGCRHARIARGSGRWPSARSTSRALERSRRPAGRNESRLPPVGRYFRRAERAGAARRTWAASDPTRDRGSCCVWLAGRGEEVVAGLLGRRRDSGRGARRAAHTPRRRRDRPPRRLGSLRRGRQHRPRSGG